MDKCISLKGKNLYNKKLRKIVKVTTDGRPTGFLLYFENGTILEFEAYMVPGCELRDPGDAAIKMQRILKCNMY